MGTAAPPAAPHPPLWSRDPPQPHTPPIPSLRSGVAGAPPNPLEAQREVCELSPDCDELADQIGFQEAYRRFYGPV